MKPPKTDGLWSNIEMISETQEGRQALFTTGSVIAATYMGYVGPEIFACMHDALAVFAAKYPLMDPTSMSGSLWEGAKHFSASSLDYIASITDAFALDMSKTFRDSVATCREFLGRGSDRGIETARLAFSETAEYLGGFAAQAVETARSAATAGWSFVKDNWGALMAAGAVAKEAYEFYDTGDSIYKRWFKKAKEEVKTGNTTIEEMNVTINTAVAGNEALVNADSQIGRARVAAQMNVSMQDVIWVSDQLHERLNAEAEVVTKTGVQAVAGENYIKFDLGSLNPDELLGDRRKGEARRTAKSCLIESPEIRASEMDLKNINLASAKNRDTLGKSWAASAESVRRLENLGNQSRKTSRTEFDLSDPMAFEKGSTTRGMKVDDVFADIRPAANDNLNRDPAGKDGPGMM
jgi:hypothetical protein